MIDPEIKQLHTVARNAVRDLLADLNKNHRPRITRAIAARMTTYFNDCLDNQLESAQCTNEFISLIAGAPGSLSLLAAVSTIITLCEHMEPSLRKDDTDERRRIDNLWSPN